MVREPQPPLLVYRNDAKACRIAPDRLKTPAKHLVLPGYGPSTRA